MQQLFFTMAQVAELLGESYDRVRWATLNRVVDPAQQYGKRHKVRLFTQEQIEELKQHFAKETQR